MKTHTRPAEPARKMVVFSRQEVVDALIKYARSQGEIIPTGEAWLYIYDDMGAHADPERYMTLTAEYPAEGA